MRYDIFPAFSENTLNTEGTALRGNSAEYGVMQLAEVFAGFLRARDSVTYEHSENVANMCLKMSGALGMAEEDRACLYAAGLLHDIGKIGIADSILKKPERLSGAEYAEMRGHPLVGESLLAGLPGFDDIRRYIRHHHERYDGGGYPDGLSAFEIPLGARIISLADAYDAMTTRDYRGRKDRDSAISEIKRLSGRQFDTEIAGEFLHML